MHRHTFLLVERRPRTVGIIDRELRTHGWVRVVTSVEDAGHELERHAWAGVILGGAGQALDPIALLRFMRRVGNPAPAAVLTRGLAPELASACHRFGGRPLLEPIDRRAIRRFAVRALARRRVLDPSSTVAVLAVERDLTTREAEVLRLVAGGVRRDALPEALGVSDNTVKGHVRGVLRKLRSRRLETAALAALEGLVRRRMEAPDPIGHPLRAG